jgi:hypothetical protein
MPKVILAEDPREIAKWSAHCLEEGLYLERGVARDCFLGKREIHRMAIVPHIAWGMDHEYGLNHGLTTQWASYFTRPVFRRRCIGHALWRVLYPAAYETWKKDNPEKARLVESNEEWALVLEWEVAHAGSL